jgi:hypothetical protein
VKPFAASNDDSPTSSTRPCTGGRLTCA